MEERQNLIKDLSIVRQSSIKIALEFCKVHGIQPSMKELIRLTDIFAEDALLTPDKQFKESVKKIDEWVVSKKNI